MYDNIGRNNTLILRFCAVTELPRQKKMLSSIAAMRYAAQCCLGKGAWCGYVPKQPCNQVSSRLSRVLHGTNYVIIFAVLDLRRPVFTARVGQSPCMLPTTAMTCAECRSPLIRAFPTLEECMPLPPLSYSIRENENEDDLQIYHETRPADVKR
jgi:hypothetical protein